MLKYSKLTLRVTEAASAVCGITFHPNGMDGGPTTVTLTLLLYATLPRLTLLSLGWSGMRLPTFTISPVSPKNHNHLPITDIYPRRCSCKRMKTNMLGSQMSSSGFILKIIWMSLVHVTMNKLIHWSARND